MTTHLETLRRVRAQIARERATLLDHGVSFQIEDSWRSYWSTDPLRPPFRVGKPHPVGKQAHAHARSSNRGAAAYALLFLADLQRATCLRVEGEVRDARRLAQRRLRAAQEPLVVIEPQSSLPGSQRTVAELEKRCLLPIEEIRSCFRQGRRSAGQQAVRDRVEDAIRAMVKHYRMDHPATGTPQFAQARREWREFVGYSLMERNNRHLAFDVFGETDDDGEMRPGEYMLEPQADGGGNRPGGRRVPRSRTRSQIVNCIASALEVYPQRVREIVAKTGTRTDYSTGQLLSQEGS